MSEQPKRQIGMRDVLVIVVVLGLLAYVVVQNLNTEAPVEEEIPTDTAPSGLIAE